MEALAYIVRHDKVWLATGREIARHFLAHDFDAFAAAGLRLDPDVGRVILRARHRAARITLVARRRRVQELGGGHPHRGTHAPPV